MTSSPTSVAGQRRLAGGTLQVSVHHLPGMLALDDLEPDVRLRHIDLVGQELGDPAVEELDRRRLRWWRRQVWQAEQDEHHEEQAAQDGGRVHPEPGERDRVVVAVDGVAHGIVPPSGSRCEVGRCGRRRASQPVLGATTRAVANRKVSASTMAAPDATSR